MTYTPRRNPNERQGDGARRPSARAVATELYTLGGVRVTQQGSALDVKLGSKHLALLIYLFHERRPMHPLEVVELLGHGQDVDRELDGLKRTVKWLNQAVPFVNIRMTAETVEGVSGVWLDTMDIEAAIDARKPVRVAQLYSGEFLEGFESGVQAFDEWANRERGRLKRAWEHAMTRAAREAGEAGKWRTAAEWWRVVVSRAPMRSEPVAHLLEAYARTGRREEAIQAYSDYAERLRRSGVADLPGVIKQVIAGFPMLQRIAAKSRPSSAEVTPPARETPQPERQLPPWDLEPAPAPPDAFDLTFELPEADIPIGPAPLNSASPAERSAPNAYPTRATPTNSFHALDEPVRADFGVGLALERSRRPADELLVETVAMSFEKIAADSLDPDSADRNGDSAAEGELESTGHPEGIGDNSVHDLRDGNGANPALSKPPDKAEPVPSREPREGQRAKSESSRGGDTREPAVEDSPPAQSLGPVRDEGDRDRDLYRATAAILAAFVDDDDDADDDDANEGGGDRWIGGIRASGKAGLADRDRPVEDAPDPWDDFGSGPGLDGPAEADPVAHPDRGTTPSAQTAGVAWEAPSQGPALPWDGQAVLFEDYDLAGPDSADLDLDEVELYGGRVTRVRHQVTSVRKPWRPVLRDAWAGVSGWVVESLGAFWARLRRSTVDEQPMDPEERLDVAGYDALRPTAAPTDAAEYTTSHEGSEPIAPAMPTPFSGGAARGTSLDGLPADGSEEASGPSYQELEEEASVEWYEEWQSGTTDAAIYEAYEVEGDLYAPAAKGARVEPIAVGGVASLFRRYWYAPVGAIIIAAALAFGPRLIGLFGGQGGETGGAEDLSSPKPSLPKLKVRAPAFVETSVSKISRLFSSSILDAPGEWVVVADLQTSPTNEPTSVESEGAAGGVAVTPAALTLALEADLMQARFFFVFPRGRALAALGSEGGGALETFSVEDALSLAAAEGISAVIAGTLYRGVGEENLVLRVIRPDGDTAYTVSRLVSSETGRLAALTELTRAVRRRLGEPADDLEASLPIQAFLSDNPEAVNSYAESFEHFRAGRYREARLAATAATQRDSTFAVAHHLLARSLAVLGARRQAQAALQTAAAVRERATERERLRILGDWLAWTGRTSDAALTYDELFDRYRDDVGALRSQAVVQRLIGAPGGGLGNLRVAYAIDRHDWPNLAQLAQYLGYRGPLPSRDSLAATGSTPSPEPNN